MVLSTHHPNWLLPFNSLLLNLEQLATVESLQTMTVVVGVMKYVVGDMVVAEELIIVTHIQPMKQLGQKHR